MSSATKQKLLVEGVAVPPALEQLARAAEASRAMLDLPDDWDEEGSPAYAEDTWRRAVHFLLRTAIRLWETCRIRTEAPRILPGPEGSVDIHWKTQRRELLVNIPVDPSEPAGYYGDDYGDLKVKGTLDTNAENRWLLMWLSE